MHGLCWALGAPRSFQGWQEPNGRPSTFLRVIPTQPSQHCSQLNKNENLNNLGSSASSQVPCWRCHSMEFAVFRANNGVGDSIISPTEGGSRSLPAPQHPPRIWVADG
jgi:hypothetical protein